MNILGLETSTESCSVALQVGNNCVSRFEIAPRLHSRLILPMIDSVLAEAGIVKTQLDAISFGRGPGAFTGVRLASAVTQGIALGLDRPVIPVSSLAILAQGAFRLWQSQHCVVAFDARMGELYWANYRLEDNYMQLSGEERVLGPEQIELPPQGDWDCLGSGFDEYQQIILPTHGARFRFHPQQLPHALDLITIALVYAKQKKWLDAQDAIPVYVRNQVARKPGSSTI